MLTEQSGKQSWFGKLREKISNPVVGLSVGAALLLLAAILFVRFMTKPPPKAILPQAYNYYSVDDGATYFKAGLNVAPCQIEGKGEAVEALVCRVGSGKPFIAYLLKYEPETKASADKMLQSTGRYHIAFQTGQLIKAPGAGDDKWEEYRGTDQQRSAHVGTLPPGVVDNDARWSRVDPNREDAQ